MKKIIQLYADKADYYKEERQSCFVVKTAMPL
jgi:hypothetical protein